MQKTDSRTRFLKQRINSLARTSNIRARETWCAVSLSLSSRTESQSRNRAPDVTISSSSLDRIRNSWHSRKRTAPIGVYGECLAWVGKVSRNRHCTRRGRINTNNRRRNRAFSFFGPSKTQTLAGRGHQGISLPSARRLAFRTSGSGRSGRFPSTLTGRNETRMYVHTWAWARARAGARGAGVLKRRLCTLGLGEGEGGTGEAGIEED